MTTVYQPILFSGLIELASTVELNEDEMKQPEEGGKVETIHDFNYEVQYEKIACGKGNSVALINKPPFLLTWGYGHDKAWGFPRIFKDDKPV